MLSRCHLHPEEIRKKIYLYQKLIPCIELGVIVVVVVVPVVVVVVFIVVPLLVQSGFSLKKKLIENT